MTALGFVLLLVGAALMVAEAHAPGGVFGVAGGLGLIVGGIVLIGALGGGAILAIPVAAGIGAVAVGWTVVATRKAASARRGRIQSGKEALCGRIGVVRQWDEPAGNVFVDGALWRAQHDWAGREQSTLEEGDRVVVERVNGLTLMVRRAEDWELVA
ncbi:MAG TPA: NfeD family protein [Thermoleophilaceae bacterium]|jgi:membrane-bound serine protease (ClpP class)|nr:NfeD family protein [Thermoleophilaceae bacterium]